MQFNFNQYISSFISVNSKALLGLIQILAWACEKVASDLGLGGGFRRALQFPLPSNELATIGINVRKKRNSRFQIQFF